MSSSPQLHQVSFREQALAVIRHEMITGEIVPGEIYSAAALAQKLGVSNSPVREAMLALVNEGLMEAVRNRGFRVVPLSDRDRQNIYELRLMIEPRAMARLAADGKVAGSEARFAEMAAETVRCARERDLAGHLENDRRFHVGLIEFLENQYLTDIVTRLRDQTRRYSLKLLPGDQLVANSLEHASILAAVVAGEAEAAERLMTEHLAHLAQD